MDFEFIFGFLVGFLVLEIIVTLILGIGGINIYSDAQKVSEKCFALGYLPDLPKHANADYRGGYCIVDGISTKYEIAALLKNCKKDNCSTIKALASIGDD